MLQCKLCDCQIKYTHKVMYMVLLVSAVVFKGDNLYGSELRSALMFGFSSLVHILNKILKILCDDMCCVMIIMCCFKPYLFLSVSVILASFQSHSGMIKVPQEVDLSKVLQNHLKTVYKYMRYLLLTSLR